MIKLLIFNISLYLRKYSSIIYNLILMLLGVRTVNKALSNIETRKLIKAPRYFKTIYLNFRCLKFREACKIPIFIYGNIRLISLRGRICFEGNIPHMGGIKIGKDLSYRSCVQGLIRLDGSLFFRNVSQGLIQNGISLNVSENAILSIGDNFFVGENVQLFCTEKISIGDWFCITYQSQLFDSDFHFTVDLSSRTIKPRSKPIVIGDYVWIGNHTTIKKGVVIPDYTIVAASYSLLTKDYSSIPPYSILGGSPAKVISSNHVRTWGKDTIPEIEKIDAWFRNHPNKDVFEIEDESLINEYITSPNI